MNKNMDKEEKKPESPINAAISEALVKLKDKPQPKEGVDLLSITKKLSSKKFGKK